MTYVFQRGETISFALDLTDGNFGGVSAVSIAMKPLGVGRSVPDPATPAIQLSVAANGTTGWTATLDAVASAALVPGSYLADARMTVSGGTIITDPVAIRIVEGVSS